MDNCLLSLDQAKHLIDKMSAPLASGGFEIREWASIVPEVVFHIPTATKSVGCELLLTAKMTDLQESTLGLLWRSKTYRDTRIMSFHQLNPP